MEQAVADLETIRRVAGVDSWVAIGHSWGSDLAVRYAVEHPDRVRSVIGIAGRGPQRDRSWSEAYESGVEKHPVVEIDYAPTVHAALSSSFKEWIRRPRLWRDLADCQVPMHFIAAGDDIRPSWPLAQLAELVPNSSLSTVAGVPHDFWSSHPDAWYAALEGALALQQRPARH